MKKLLLITLLLGSMLNFNTDWFEYWRADYFVSETGSDTNNGRTPWTAWQTITKVNATTFSAGDDIAFNGTFTGTITVGQSGTAGNPITFKSYGDGATISGFTTITGWTDEGGGIYSKAIATESDTINMVTVDGINTAMGRFPNTGWNTYESSTITTKTISSVANYNSTVPGTSLFTTSANHLLSSGDTVTLIATTNYDGTYTATVVNATQFYVTKAFSFNRTGILAYNVTITDTSLGETTDWAGAELVFRQIQWSLVRARILNHSGNVLKYNPNNATWSNAAGYGYFIQNDLRTLDQLGEWYYDGDTLFMYFGAVDPTTKTVKVSATNKGTYINDKDYITLKNIRFEGINQYAVQNESGQNIRVENCDFENIGVHGVYTSNSSSGALITIDNNTFDNINDHAINLRATTNTSTITNNTLDSIGLVLGLNTDLNVDAISIYNSNSLIQYNTITNVGHSGIAFRSGRNTQIKNNFISNNGLSQYDAGAIYLWSAKGIVQNNIAIGASITGTGIASAEATLLGLYFDEKCDSVTISQNTISGFVGRGISYYASKNGTIRENTSYNNGKQFGLSYNSTYTSIGYNVTGMTVKNNTLVSKAATQNIFEYYNNTSPFTDFGVADSNMYARPIITSVPQINLTSNYTTSNNYDILGWRTATGQDSDTELSPYSVNSADDFVFEYNASTAATTVTFADTVVDFEQNQYKSITLQPYTSFVGLIKDSTSAAIYQATVGNTTILAESSGNGNRRAAPYTMPVDGTITSITMYHTAGASGNVKYGLYADNGSGSPGAKLGETAGVAVTNAAEWQKIDLTTPVEVEQGTVIWVAWVYQTIGTANIRYSSATTTNRAAANASTTYASGMPDPFGASTLAAAIYSLYCTFEYEP